MAMASKSTINYIFYLNLFGHGLICKKSLYNHDGMSKNFKFRNISSPIEIHLQ